MESSEIEQKGLEIGWGCPVLELVAVGVGSQVSLAVRGNFRLVTHQVND
jgi:hypothetical protein